MFLRTCDAYFNQKILRLTKVEPPIKVARNHPQGFIWLANPYPDWTGAWTERGGRSLMIETKSTMEPQLHIGASTNLSVKQICALGQWHAAGAAVGVVWCYSGHGSVFLPIKLIDEICMSGRKHIKFAEGDKIEQGKGFVLVDFVANLRRWYP